MSQISLQEWQTLRNLYIVKKFFTYEEYYLLLANKMKLTINDFTSPDASGITEDMIINSKDRSFNDIPLEKWDRLHPIIQHRAAWHFPTWSLSDSVCCMKIIAEEYRKEHQK